MTDEGDRPAEPRPAEGGRAAGEAADAGAEGWPGQPRDEGQPGWQLPAGSWPSAGPAQSWAGQPTWAPTAPTRPQLRPLGGYGEYIWWFYRRHGPMMIVISLVTSIPTLIVAIPTAFVSAQYVRRQQELFGSPFSPNLPSAAAFRELAEMNVPLLLIGAIATVIGILSILATGAAIAWLVRTVEDRQRPSVGASLDAIVDRLPALLGLWVVLTIIAVVGQLFGGVAGIGGTLLLTEPARGGPLLLVGLVGALVWLVVGAILGIRWSLAVSAIAIDGLPTRPALERSWAWTNGNAWRIFGFGLAAALVALLVVLLPLGIATVLLLPGTVAGNTGVIVLSSVLNWVATGVITPIFAILIARIYLDLRGQLAPAEPVATADSTASAAAAGP